MGYIYKSHMAEAILLRIRKENVHVNIMFTTEMYNEALLILEDLCLDIANKLLTHLKMPSPNRSAAPSFDVEMHREPNYNKGDLLSYVQSNIPRLTLEQNCIMI